MFKLAAPVLLMVALTGVLCAQSTNASISGYVTDPSKAVIQDAKVIVINTGTNARQEAITNKIGSYNLVNLPPGSYRVEVEKAGFATVVKSDVVLHVQDAVAINFEMRLGSASEIVTVTSGAPLVNTQDASVSTVVDQSYIANMPLNGRSFQDLILLTPGVVTQTPQNPGFLGGSGEFSVNGQRTEENYYTVDGVSANVGTATGNFQIAGAAPSGSIAASTALGTTQALVSVDDLQEFRVQSSSYSAQFGRAPGGQFAFETKSGTNLWHGSAYDYLRNSYFDSRDWFDDYLSSLEPHAQSLHQNDFGGTFGGPVVLPGLYNGKDKTFFFVSYEGLRLVAPQAPTIDLFVPDMALRQSAAPAIQPEMNAYPLPTPGGVDFGDGTAQYIASWSNPDSIDTTSVRFDHMVKDKLRLFFRFSNSTSDGAIRNQFQNLTPSVRTTFSPTNRTYTFGATSLLSPRLNNDLRLNYTSNEAASTNAIVPIGGSSPVDLRQVSGLGTGADAAFSLPFANGGAANMQLDQEHEAGAQRQWNLVDTVSLTVGRHQFTFGADYRRLAPTAVRQTPSIGYTYVAPQAVIDNNTTDGLLNISVEVSSPAYPLYKNFSAFANDEWRVSQRLNLSMGLRCEVNPPPGVTKGLMPYTLRAPDGGALQENLNTLVLAPQGTPLWNTTWFNFAPRLGAAYALRDKQGWETVLRGGGGVFFDTGQQNGSQAFNGPGFAAFNFLPGAPPYDGPYSFPVNAPSLVVPIQNPPATPYFPGPVGYAPHLQLPYTLQWNASLQQALGKSQSLTVSYVGSRASRLLELNSYSYPNLNNPNAFYLFLVLNGGYSRYESLQTEFSRRLSRGLTALGSYTWSHCIDSGSINSFLGYTSGNCDFDVRHNFSSAFSYDVPNVGQNRFVNAILHHWGVDNRMSARTAFPLALFGGNYLGPDIKTYNLGLNLVPGQPIYLYGANCASFYQSAGVLQPGFGCPGGRAVNPSAFALAVDANGNPTQGDAPRNLIRGFGAWQMDLAVRREFPVSERLKLQFRAEAFNIFNHPILGLSTSIALIPPLGW